MPTASAHRKGSRTWTGCSSRSCSWQSSPWLAPRALVLARYPRALALFAGAAVLAATSQAIDATARVSEWEFVVEDGAKALAGPFLLAGYLAALRVASARRSH